MWSLPCLLVKQVVHHRAIIALLVC
jgi:hypothetical protein